MMKLAILVLAFGVSSNVQANSIPISGTATQGFAITAGDFHITGRRISLFQSLPDGPGTIGSCVTGITCDFSFTITAGAGNFCSYCLGYDTGLVGNQSADLFKNSLIFTGSALYTGTVRVTVPMTFSSTITGFELVDCDSNGNNCSLGAQTFSLYISGTATGQFSMQPGSNASILGVNATLQGSTSTVPEPISLALTGTGLIAIWIRACTSHKPT